MIQNLYSKSCALYHNHSGSPCKGSRSPSDKGKQPKVYSAGISLKALFRRHTPGNSHTPRLKFCCFLSRISHPLKNITRQNMRSGIRNIPCIIINQSHIVQNNFINFTYCKIFKTILCIFASN